MFVGCWLLYGDVRLRYILFYLQWVIILYFHCFIHLLNYQLRFFCWLFMQHTHSSIYLICLPWKNLQLRGLYLF